MGRLPIHLHPDDETAQRLYSEPNGKTEAWHILWAAPNASENNCGKLKPSNINGDRYESHRE